MCLLQIKSSKYLKLNIDIIANSVKVGDCFIRISDCSISVFRSSLLIMEVGFGRLCQHNNKHNRQPKASGIMLAY